MIKSPILFAFLALTLAGVCSSQKLGDRQTVQGCYMRAEAGWSGLCKRNSDSRSCIHNPSRCGWVIVSYKPVITNQNGGSYSASLISGQAQYTLITITEVEQHYKSLIDAAGKLGLFDIKSKLESEYSEKISRFSSYYNNGVQTLSGEAKATARGSCVDRQRGWVEMHYSLVEEYVGCTVQELTQELESDPVFKEEFASVKRAVQSAPSPTPTPTPSPRFVDDGPIRGPICNPQC